MEHKVKKAQKCYKNFMSSTEDCRHWHRMGIVTLSASDVAKVSRKLGQYITQARCCDQGQF